MNSNFWSLHYWLNLNPGNLEQTGQQSLSIFFGLVVLAGIVGYMFASKSAADKLLARVYRKIGRLGITMGIIGFFMIFLFYQEIYIFSARFWFLIWLVVVAVWVRSIVHLAKVKIPREKRTLAEQQAFERYLPQKKR